VKGSSRQQREAEKRLFNKKEEWVSSGKWIWPHYVFFLKESSIIHRRKGRVDEKYKHKRVRVALLIEERRGEKIKNRNFCGCFENVFFLVLHLNVLIPPPLSVFPCAILHIYHIKFYT
jgi:hypothetical protein